MCLDEKSLAMLKQIKQNVVGEEIENGITPDPETETQEKQPKGSKANANGIVSLVAYLIGIPREHFGKEYDTGVFERLEGEETAKIIRSLCVIRNELVRQPGTIAQQMKMHMKNLDTMPEIIDPEYFRYLENHNIHLIKGSCIKPVVDYIVCVNQEISNRINNCLNLVPAYVNKEFIRDLIVIPGGSKTKEAQSMIDRMKSNFNSYPFQCTINWPVEAEYYHTDIENIYEAKPEGNVLAYDRKFLTLLYRVHGETFTDWSHCSDAAPETKELLRNFVAEHSGAVLLVDCENADPFKLVAALDFLRTTDAGKNGGIGKIVLFDDYHTPDTWDILEAHVHAPVIHEEVERILGHKSLVDIALTAEACRLHYAENVGAFLIASSDSDFWGMMRSMPDCDFLILAEESKISPEAIRNYDDHGISVCPVDDFSANLAGLREDAVRMVLEKRLNNLCALNVYDMLEELYESLRINPSDAEKENDRRTYSKSLKIEVNPEGGIVLRLNR